MADDPSALIDEYLRTVLMTLVRDVRLEAGERCTSLGRITGVHFDASTLTLRITVSEEGAAIVLHGDWDGFRKISTTARRISPAHDAATALELLKDEKDPEVH